MSRLGRYGKRSALFTLMVAAASAAILVLGSDSIFGSEATPRSAPWRLLPSAPIEIDAGRTSVWTGKEMFVSGVRASSGGSFVRAVDVAAAYEPATNTWRRLPPPPNTESYCRRSAVWTGTEMLVWGCAQVAFDPAENRWRRLPPAPVGPPGLAVWTGRELIGWGGGCCGDASADGAAYDPATNSWRKLARSPLVRSQSPVGAWTGTELVVFVSGLGPEGKPNEGERAAAYNPVTDTWRRIAPAPALRSTAVWDGRELLLVGGAGGDAYSYSPASDRWRRLPAVPSGGIGATATWTGKELLLYGGEAAADTLVAYEPDRNRWFSLPKAPLRQRLAPAAVWTGHELILWGGVIGTPAGTSMPPEHPVDGAAYSPSLRRVDEGG